VSKKSQPSVTNDRLTAFMSNGNIQQLADAINSSFYSVSADLAFLVLSLSPVADDVLPERFIIKPSGT